MDAKNILNPKGWLIGLGALMILISIPTMLDGQTTAEQMWGEDNVEPHDAAYEEMWALHMVPLGIMAVATGLLVKGEALAKMAMTAAVSLTVVVGGGMLYMTGETGYASDMPAAFMMIPVLLGVILGISGYLHMNDDETPATEA